MNKLNRINESIKTLQSQLASEKVEENKSALILNIKKLEAEREEVIKFLSMPRNRMVSAK